MTDVTVVIVPGLRDHVPGHWQTLLKARLPHCRAVEPMGRTELDCASRVAALEREVTNIKGEIVLVAHSGGVVTVLHWASRTKRPVRGALLATPADMETPMPAGYPSLPELQAAGWLPMPQDRLPFAAIVAASRNDPLASFPRVAGFAGAWGGRLVDIGRVGHLNPASGFGPWPRAEEFIGELMKNGTYNAN